MYDWNYSRYEPLFGSWRVVRLLGQGSAGHVYEIVREELGCTYHAALKVISLPEDQEELRRAVLSGIEESRLPQYYRNAMESIVNEIRCMAKLKGNSNIVSYEDHMVIPHDDGIGYDILTRMELLTPFTDYVLDYEMTEEDVLNLGLDLTSALMTCEKADIIHRDIKPDNIFVTESGSFKLGDFGVARVIEETDMNLSHRGTLAYMAPEVYRGEPYTAVSDIYSLGLVLYKYLNKGRLPFMPAYPNEIRYEDSGNAMTRRARRDEFPNPAEGSTELKRAVMKACSGSAEDRYSSAAEFHEALEDIKYDRRHGKEYSENKPGDADTGSVKKRLVIIAAAAVAVLLTAAGIWTVIPHEVEDITGVDPEESVYIGEELAPEYTVEPKRFRDEPLSFASSDESVFTVDETGSIRAVSVGEADMTISAKEYTETVHINVVPKVTEIGGIDDNLIVTEGESLQLEPVLKPEKFSNETVTYNSENPDVASVSEDGMITAIAPGEAEVKLSSGGTDRIVTVTVNAIPEPVYYPARKNSSSGSSSGKSGKTKGSSKGSIDSSDDEYF